MALEGKKKQNNCLVRIFYRFLKFSLLFSEQDRWKKPFKNRSQGSCSNKRVESQIFAIFTVERTKTSFTTKRDHAKNYVQSMRNLQHWLFKNQQCSESCIINIQVLIFFYWKPPKHTGWIKKAYFFTTVFFCFH